MAAPEDTPAGVPPPGTVLGRYVVDALIGRGAMGVVVRAYDPELDRTVALKLLATGGGPQHAGGRARLLREAQAMARLSHPNIVRVHDVGVVDEQAFVAFERIDGGTLRSWWHPGRTLPEILATYAAAGRGLAAAHEAGLVHRDFKPDNVLIDGNGGVFVTDFGLVRVGPPTRPSVSRAMAALPQLDDADVTVAGAIVGTPAYMAPEQLEGGDVDERSDQFSFCVALYEAVYGTRPFVGSTVDRLASAVMREQFAPVPPGRRAPGWLRALLRKGLRRYPGERFASMHALLHELAAAPRRRRVAIAAIATLGAGALALTLGSWSRSRPCRELERDDAGRAAALASELASSQASDDPLRRDAATAAMAWQQRWGATREQACRASFERGERSREGFTAVDACLQAAHADVVALAARVAAPSPSPRASRALAAAAARLPDPQACRRRLASAQDDATAAAASLRVLASLSIAPPPGHEASATMLPEAALAQAHAEAAPQADATLQRALIEGERRRRLGVVAQAWVARARLLLHHGGDEGELTRTVRVAHAAIERAGDDAMAHADVDAVHAQALRRAQRLDEALEHAVRVQQRRAEVLPADDLELAEAALLLASIHRDRGEHEQALAQCLRALAIVQARLGPAHPAAAAVQWSVADALLATGADQAAAARRRQAAAGLAVPLPQVQR
ncbi:MAG: serine/threonine-protein kinase [Nannocystaceae bacterium]|nr:serine/threonine-protein kinase [Nannocystaceae bacterium]